MSLLVAVPMYRETKEKRDYFARLAKELGAELTIVGGCPLIEYARALIEARFMASKCERLLCLDDDVRVRVSDVRAMIAEDLNIIAVAYPDRHVARRRWTIRTFDAAGTCNVVPRPSGRRVLESAGVGFGCVLITKNAVSHMWAAHPELEFRSEEGPACMTFLPMIGPDHDGASVFYGEDLAWCARARAAGLKIHVLADVPIEHAGIKDTFRA